jgi:hypothetical protein
MFVLILQLLFSSLVGPNIFLSIFLSKEKRMIFFGGGGRPEEKRTLGRPRIQLKWVFEKGVGESWTGLICFRIIWRALVNVVTNLRAS